MKILRYTVPSWTGDYITVLVQAATREEADRVAEEHVQLQRGRFHWSDRTITDLSNSPVIESSIWDHELGEEIAVPR